MKEMFKKIWCWIKRIKIVDGEVIIPLTRTEKKACIGKEEHKRAAAIKKADKLKK